MDRKTVKTFTATIYVGSFYRAAGITISPDLAKHRIQEYVNAVGLCVTVTPTEFMYTDGSEPGLIVGLINYPRFPTHPALLRKQALEIADLLRVFCRQERVSVVFPDETVMLGVGEGQ